MTKNILINIILLLTLTACSFAEDQKALVNKPEKKLKKIKKDQVHILFVNFEPGSSSFSYFDKFDQQTKIVCPENKKIDIDWSNENVFKLQTLPFQGFYPVSIGDTIYITKKGFEHSEINIPTSQFSNFELNFPGFLSKRNCSIIEYFFRKFSPDKKGASKGTAKENYEQSLFLLDSCVKQGLIHAEYADWLNPILKFSYYQAAVKTKTSHFNFFPKVINDTANISNHNYRDFLKTWFVESELKTTWGKIDFRKAYTFASQKYTGVIKDYLLFFCLTNILETYPQQKKDYIKKFETACTTEKYKQYVSINYPQATIDSKGKDVLMKMEGKPFLLDSLINDNKGKIIYVDFWASWCVPCRVEMSTSLDLRSKLKDKEIVFIYLSIDAKVEAWRKASKEEKLINYENNYLLLNAPSASITKQLKISTIPRYILINKKGKIVNANTPRPSDPLLIPLLNEHLVK